MSIDVPGPKRLSSDGVPPRHKVDDQQAQPNEKQDVDQASGDVEPEPHQPEDQDHREQRPEHALSFRGWTELRRVNFDADAVKFDYCARALPAPRASSTRRPISSVPISRSPGARLRSA